MTREELLKIAKPILFNTEMVQAILEGRKTVTRRIIKPQPPTQCKYSEELSNLFYAKFINLDGEIIHLAKKPYMQPNLVGEGGDILYIREKFAHTWRPDSNDIGFIYKADGEPQEFPYWGNVKQNKFKVWIPSIHMPKIAARIFLKVTDVKVERLQNITSDYNNFNKEGIIEEHGFRSEMHRDFIDLWDSTVKKQDLDQYGWDANPWVWVIEFERVEEDLKW